MTIVRRYLDDTHWRLVAIQPNVATMEVDFLFHGATQKRGLFGERWVTYREVTWTPQDPTEYEIVEEG